MTMQAFAATCGTCRCTSIHDSRHATLPMIITYPSLPLKYKSQNFQKSIPDLKNYRWLLDPCCPEIASYAVPTSNLPETVRERYSPANCPRLSPQGSCTQDIVVPSWSRRRPSSIAYRTCVDTAVLCKFDQAVLDKRDTPKVPSTVLNPWQLQYTSSSQQNQPNRALTNFDVFCQSWDPNC